jgi:hypothetical protein
MDGAFASTVWLANKLADMISLQHAASFSQSCIGAGHRCRNADSHQLFNAANANLRPSRSLPEPFPKGPVARESGKHSHRDVTNGRLAGVGFARPQNCGQHGRRPDGNVALRLLRNILSPLWALGTVGLLRGSFLRSILLFVYPKHPLSQQGGHVRPWQGGILPIRGIAALERIKILSHCDVRRMSIPLRLIHGLSLISTVPGCS